MKRFVAMMMALIMLLGMTACGTGSNETTAVEPGESTAANTTETTEAVPVARDEDRQVVIVGGGVTGLMAATEFLMEYPDVDFVLLERQGILGGSARYSEGLILGFTDTTGADLTQFATPEMFAELFKKSSKITEDYGFEKPGFVVNEALVNNVFRNMSKVYEHIQAMGGNIHYEDMPYYNENSYSDEIYCYPAEGYGAGLADTLSNYMAEQKADVRLNSCVTELLADGNKVTGVVVEDEKGSYTIHADYVILATGGLGANREMIAEYNPAFVNCLMYTNGGSMGDGIKFTRQFNTPLVGDGVLGLLSSDDDTYAMMASNFMVGKDGKRFANESLNTYLLLLALMNNAGGEAWVIADQEYYETHKDEVDYKLQAGTVTIYESLEDICAATGIDMAGLQATIDSYNSAVENGEAAEFDLSADLAHPIHEGPYYVEKASTYCFGSIRSIQINENLQVMNGDSVPVEGLYAGGELTYGNVLNGQYAKSGTCISYGSNSGTEMAKQVGEQLK